MQTLIWTGTIFPIKIEMVNALWMRQIWFLSSQIQAKSHSWPECVPCTLVPALLSLRGLAQLVRGSCQASCAMPTKFWLGWRDWCYLQWESLSWGTGIVEKVILVESCSTRRRLLLGERPTKVVLVAEVSSTGGEWAHVGHAPNSQLPAPYSKPCTHSSVAHWFPLPPSCQGRSGCSGLSCFCVSDVIIYAIQICHVMEGEFGEGLHSLKVLNLQAEGSGLVRVILSAESS